VPGLLSNLPELVNGFIRVRIAFSHAVSHFISMMVAFFIADFWIFMDFADSSVKRIDMDFRKKQDLYYLGYM